MLLYLFTFKICLINIVYNPLYIVHSLGASHCMEQDMMTRLATGVFLLSVITCIHHHHYHHYHYHHRDHHAWLPALSHAAEVHVQERLALGHNSDN